MAVQRDANVTAQSGFNQALRAHDWQEAVRHLAEMDSATRRTLLEPLSTEARQRLRNAAGQLNPDRSDAVIADIETLEHAAPAPAGAEPTTGTGAAAGSDVDIASLPATEKLARAWGYARQHLSAEVVRELEGLFSPQSLAMMAAFGLLFVAAQLTPAGWVADGIGLALITISAFFLGAVVFQVAQDLYHFFGALNAQSAQDLNTAGQALARAAARGGVGVLVALLTKGIRGARGRPQQAPPPNPAPVAAVTPEGMIVSMPVSAAEAAVAGRPALAQQLTALSRGGGSGGTPPRGPGGSGGGGRRPPRTPTEALNTLASMKKPNWVRYGRTRDPIDPHLLEMAKQERALNAGVSTEALSNANIATARVSVDGRPQYLSSGNRPSAEHAEQWILSQMRELSRGGKRVTLEQLYSERVPCGHTCGPWLRRDHPNAQIYFTTTRHGPSAGADLRGPDGYGLGN